MSVFLLHGRNGWYGVSRTSEISVSVLIYLGALRVPVRSCKWSFREPCSNFLSPTSKAVCAGYIVYRHDSARLYDVDQFINCRFSPDAKNKRATPYPIPTFFNNDMFSRSLYTEYISSVSRRRLKMILYWQCFQPLFISYQMEPRRDVSKRVKNT